MDNRRIRYYDLLRVLSTALIIYYHFMVELWIVDIYLDEKVSPFYSTPNVSASTVAVAIFFMLSGAGLTLSNTDKFEAGKFYLKRFKTVLVPYYVTTVLYFIIKFAFYGENWIKALLNVGGIYTLFGAGEFARINGAPVISTGIGEWFLGVLIIIYVFYPVFRYLMNKIPYLFFAACTAFYVAYIYNYTINMPPVYMTIPACAYLFIVGMYLAKYFKEFPKKMMLISIPVCTFFITNKWPLGLNQALVIALCSVMLVISVSFLEPYLQKTKGKVLSFLSGFSYYLFLVHHAVIYIITPIVKHNITDKYGVMKLIALDLVVMTAAALLVMFITKMIFKGVDALKGNKSPKLSKS